MLALLIFFSLLVQTSQAANDTDCPLNIPGYSHHGDCKLLCRRAKWTDVAVFFIGNYLAHAMTIITLPGQSILLTIVQSLIALFLPGAGVWRGLRAILSLAIFAPTELQMAARASALCHVVGEELVEVNVEDMNESQITRPKAPIKATKVHGVCRLPPNYYLRLVTQDARFEHDEPEPSASFSKNVVNFLAFQFRSTTTPRRFIACSYSVVKILIALGQLGFAIQTLYRTRGDQIETYGYAAFGLTVIPYAWMSLINIIGLLIYPLYPAVFVVASTNSARVNSEADEGASTGDNHIDGTAGRLSSTTPPTTRSLSPRDLAMRILIIPVSAVPIAINGSLSGFSSGKSQLIDRFFLMAWLILGAAFGPIFLANLEKMAENREYINDIDRQIHGHRTTKALIYETSMSVMGLGGAAVAGFAVVARQIFFEYGVCNKIA